jgi:hypothetical protein
MPFGLIGLVKVDRQPMRARAKCLRAFGLLVVPTGFCLCGKAYPPYPPSVVKGFCVGFETRHARLVLTISADRLKGAELPVPCRTFDGLLIRPLRVLLLYPTVKLR